MLTHGPLWLGVDPLCGPDPSGSIWKGGSDVMSPVWTAGLGSFGAAFISEGA